MPGARLYRFAQPYAQADVGALDYEQSADVMYLAHPSYDPEKLSRFGHTDWRPSLVSFGATILPPAGPAAVATVVNTGTGYTPIATSYVVTAIQAENGQESLPSATATAGVNDLTLAGNFNTITWSAVAGIEVYQVYKQENGIFGFIGATTGLTFKDDNIAPDLGTTPQQTRTPFAGADNKPGKVTFYQQRLVWGRTNKTPNGVWTSQSANFENLNVARPAKDDDAVTFALVARQVNEISHLIPVKSLLALTSDSIFSIDGGSGGFISPSQLSVLPQGMRGASNVRPVVIDDVVFFNTSKGARIRTLNYNFYTAIYTGNDLTVFAPHFFKGYTLLDMAWLEEPTGTLWCVRNDGALIVLTWQAEQDVWGWSLCATDGFVESCCAVTENGEDRLYILVRRLVDGVERRYIERLATSLWHDVTTANYLDSSKAYSGTDLQVMTGLDHLEGRTVTALADGNVITGLVVQNGKVDLGSTFSTVIVGIPYRSYIHTLPPVVQANGSIVGLTQQISDIVIRVKNSRGLKFGSDETDSANLFETKERMDEFYGSPIDLFTGDILEKMPPEWSTQVGVALVQDYPLPMQVLGVFPAVDIGG